MNKLLFNKANRVWKEIGQFKTVGELEIEVEIYKKMLDIFQVGEYCYFIFCPPETRIEFPNASVTDLLGYTPEEFTLELFLEIIHPDDLQNYLNFEATITEFWQNLPSQKVMKYKTRYDFRIQCKNNQYKRLLQQVVPIQSDEDGAILRTFVVFTDITQLKQSNKMVLSLIGLDGEQSYFNVDPIRNLSSSNEILTKRERQIFNLLAKSFTSRQIAEELHISTATVSSHRKNIYKKIDVSSILELVQFGLEKGWI